MKDFFSLISAFLCLACFLSYSCAMSETGSRCNFEKERVKRELQSCPFLWRRLVEKVESEDEIYFFSFTTAAEVTIDDFFLRSSECSVFSLFPCPRASTSRLPKPPALSVADKASVFRGPLQTIGGERRGVCGRGNAKGEGRKA